MTDGMGVSQTLLPPRPQGLSATRGFTPFCFLPPWIFTNSLHSPHQRLKAQKKEQLEKLGTAASACLSPSSQTGTSKVGVHKE